MKFQDCRAAGAAAVLIIASGASAWSPPEYVNSNHAVDSGNDYYSIVRAGLTGQQVGVWYSEQANARVAAISSDGGTNWSAPSSLPGYAGYAEPVPDEHDLEWTDDGNFHYFQAVAGPYNQYYDAYTAVTYSRSLDGGESWTSPTLFNDLDTSTAQFLNINPVVVSRCHRIAVL